MDRFIAGQAWLEPLGDFIQSAVGGFYGALGASGRWLKDALHGTKILGHPLHPALTDVPLGAWLVAVVCDLGHLVSASVPSAAGDLALLIGTVTGLGAAAAGYTDHHETYGLAVVLALIGLLVSVFSAYLGGHLTFGIGTMVNHTAFQAGP